MDQPGLVGRAESIAFYLSNVSAPFNGRLPGDCHVERSETSQFIAEGGKPRFFASLRMTKKLGSLSPVRMNI
jgi:hypothetical protein